jgi:hypothetical protein
MMTMGTPTTNQKRITACTALLNMKRAPSNKQACYEEESTTERTVDRYEKADESRSKVDDSQMEFSGENDRMESIHYQAQALPLPLPLRPILPTIIGPNNTTNNMHFTSRYSDPSPPSHETCSNSCASNESQQRCSTPRTSNTSEEMNPSTPPGNGDIGNAGHSTKRTWNQMVLVERAPEPLSSIPSLPLRPLPKHPSPMSPAPVLWMPVHIPAPNPAGAVVVQAPGVHDPNRYIVVTAGNYQIMANAVLQQALTVIQVPANLRKKRTKPKALQYLKSYFLAVRDRSHAIYVVKDTLAKVHVVVIQ